MLPAHRVKSREHPAARRLEAQKAAKSAPKRALATDEELACTVFVGNVPVSATRQQLETAFSTFGRVASSRFRSVPVTSTPVAKGKREEIKRAGAILGKYDESRDSKNAYVVFQEPATAKAAVEAGTVDFEGKRLRVDAATRPGEGSGSHDVKRTVFVGNVAFDTNDDELRDWFQAHLTDPGFNVESVRLIRDAHSIQCKGFGYVKFNDAAAVLAALALGSQEFKGRELRISKCVKSKARGAKPSERPAKGSRKARTPRGGGGDAAGNSQRPAKRQRRPASAAKSFMGETATAGTKVRPRKPMGGASNKGKGKGKKKKQ